MDEKGRILFRIKGREIDWDCPYSNLGHLVFNGPEGETILTHRNDEELRIKTGRFRKAVTGVMGTFNNLDLAKGDTICILRLSKAPETPVAVAYAAASVLGLRILLPMTIELSSLENWLRITGTKILLWSRYDVENLERTEKGEETILAVETILNQCSIQVFDLEKDFHIWEMLTSDDLNNSLNMEDIGPNQRASRDDPNVLISTSGSNGESKLVEITHGQFLDSCTAWQSEGLFTSDRFAGPGFTPLFSHTMGLRYFWNSLWTGTPTCLLTPEWFVDRPERASALLSKFLPTHITAGPAMIGLILELSREFPDILRPMLSAIKCCVFSGVPYDENIASLFESVTGVKVYNAFGTTETMQITNTMFGTSKVQAQSLGNPLPGVEIGLRSVSDSVFDLLVKSRFGSTDYFHQPEASSSGGFIRIGEEDWFDTGDLVEYHQDNIFHSGRRERDFIKDGFGVKIPLLAVRQLFSDVHPSIEHIEAFPCFEGPGLGMLLFVNAQSDKNDQLLAMLKDRLSMKNRALDEMLEEFESRHIKCRRFSLSFLDPPRTMKGEVDRRMIEIGMQGIVEALKDGSASREERIIEIN